MDYRISGTTGLICLLGSPVRHSLSPAMHNEGFQKLGLDYAYMAFEATEGTLPAVVKSLKFLHARGWNLTMPCKTAMLSLCDKLSPAAELCGAVNTVVNDDGVLTGYTTDGIGFMRSCQESGHDPVGKKITMLGAGGAGTAVLVQAALDGVSEISVFTRSSSRYHDKTVALIEKLNEQTSCKVTRFDYDHDILKRELDSSYMLVNTTNIGMAPDTDNTLIEDPDLFHPGLVVADLIYNPRETKLLRMAKERGCETFNGLYMLLYQGAAAFKLWTGEDMPVELIREKYFNE